MQYLVKFLLAGSIVAGMQFLSGDSTRTSRTSVRIGEVLAINENLCADEVGQFEDYVVLHNPTHAHINLGGMYLSDDWDYPRRWRIPDGTTVAPKSHIRIWADNDPDDGPLHATFRLSSKGETVLLFDTDANNNVLLDGVAFQRQLPDRPMQRDSLITW